MCDPHIAITTKIFVCTGDAVHIMGWMKQCTKCLITKPLDLFRVNEKMNDGRSSWCKPCQNKSSEESKKSDMDVYRAKARAKYERLKLAINEKRRAKYVEKNGAKDLLTPDEVKVRINARKKARRAVATGLLVKTPCHVCGSEKSEIHHSDYDQPLNVVWLCRKHHCEAHEISS